MRLDDYLAPFLDGLEGQSPANRSNYRWRLRPFLARFGHKKARDVTRADVNAFNEWLDERGYAQASRAAFQQALKKFLSDACAEVGIVSPARHLKRESSLTGKPKAPPEKDVRRCLNVAWRNVWQPLDQVDSPRSDERRRIQDGAVYLLSVETGARRRELVSIRKSHMLQGLRAPDENGVYTVWSVGKTGNVDLEFTDVAAAAVSRWIDVRPALAVDRLWSTPRRSIKRSKPKAEREARFRPLTSRALTDCFYRICEEAGVPKHASHALRHRLGHLITSQLNPKLAAIKLNHSDWQTAATATAFYYRPDREEASRVTVTMRPDVPETSRVRPACREAKPHSRKR